MVWDRLKKRTKIRRDGTLEEEDKEREEEDMGQVEEEK